MNGDGRGVYYFPETVYHMFDFTGDGAEEVITIGPGRLRVYGSSSASRSTQRVVRSPEYLKDNVANHTHY
jgi:hypothetical protein